MIEHHVDHVSQPHQQADPSNLLHAVQLQNLLEGTRSYCDWWIAFGKAGFIVYRHKLLPIKHTMFVNGWLMVTRTITENIHPDVSTAEHCLMIGANISCCAVSQIRVIEDCLWQQFNSLQFQNLSMYNNHETVRLITSAIRTHPTSLVFWGCFSSAGPWSPYKASNCNAQWLKRRGLVQGSAFWGS